MPSLKLSPEHFMINEGPRNFVKEHIEKALEGSDDEDAKETKNYKQAEGKKTIESKILKLDVLIIC